MKANRSDQARVRPRPLGRLILAAAVLALPPGTSLVRAQTHLAVWTYHNDNARTGQNLQESRLTLANVNSDSFGLLFTRKLDGWVFAQPLYISGVSLPGGGIHNVVFVATEHDSVYAFDADDNTGANANPLWHVSFLNAKAGITTVPMSDYGFNDPPELGITGTPVIDTQSGTLYVVAVTKEIANGQPIYLHRLHALDIQTGAERTNSPVAIQASFAGSGDGSDNQGVIQFDSFYHLQRPGLLLLNGAVYAAFGSIGDHDPYHGWLLGFDAQTLVLRKIFNDTPDGGEGGIWMSGVAPAVDPAGNIYCMTGNGDFDADTGGRDYGNSFVQLAPTADTNLAVSDYFTPYDQLLLSQEDGDLGSGGPMVLPEDVGSRDHPRLLLGGGKEGTIYLLDRDNLGHFNSDNDSQIVQPLIHSLGSIFSAPAYFNHLVYFLAFEDVLKAFSISNGQLSAEPVSQGSTQFGFTGATPSISANGTNNAIVWVAQVDGWQAAQPTILRAYNATNLSEELYNTTQAGPRDVLGPALKFTVPTVANGKVYVCTANALNVLGTLGTPLVTTTAPVLTSPTLVTNRFTLSVPTTPGLSYILEYTPTLSPPDWNSLQSQIGNGASLTFTDTSITATTRFYRVRVNPAN